MKIKVLNLDEVPDTQNERFLASGVEFESEFVPVSLEYGVNIGTARLTKEADGVFADMNIHEDAVNLIGGLTPSVNGSTLSRKGGLLEKTLIKSIALTLKKNADTR